MRFWKRSMSVCLGAVLVLLLVTVQANWQRGAIAQPLPATVSGLSASPAELLPLPYAYDALEPYIDAETMRLHHDMHHASYVTKLNEAVQKHSELQGQTVEALLSNLDALPEDVRTAIRNNGGGHLNHTMFWQIMKPDGGGEPMGAIATVINENFGGFEAFKQTFNQAGADRFGSGWVWLVRNAQGGFEIISTPNQDSPVMVGTYPIMGNDVWEHAYYLAYRNRRPEYLSSWWNVVNWEEINRRLAAAS
ncbi:MAG: superoxide dismutase [Leptolyngbyaceae cyanobacterium SM1_3_5]|nr:superoxide dismutase [Leptolyngbyaceae cyanobacterium SM1_3_5]